MTRVKAAPSGPPSFRPVHRLALLSGVVLALATQASFDGSLTFCGMTGELMPGCECPEAESATLEPIDCCVRVESNRLDEAPRPPAVAIAVAAPLGSLRARPAQSPRREGDPPPPLRLFLRLRTLVI